MKNLKFIAAGSLLAAALLAGSSASAQRYNERDSQPYREGYTQETRGEIMFSRGDRLPPRYRGADYRVEDARANNLRSPPRGQYWVRVNNQFLMVSARAGTVTEVVRVDNDRFAGRDRGRDGERFRDRDRDGDRNDRWRARYNREYSANTDSFYSECQPKVDPAGVIIGAFLGGIIGNAAGGRNNQGASTAAGVFAGGAIGAMLSNNLDCEDRTYAYRAYGDGFNAGRPNATYQWRNPRNSQRGEIHVRDYYDDPDGFRCANYTQRIFIGNRPEEASGRACRQPNGSWAMVD